MVRVVVAGLVVGPLVVGLLLGGLLYHVYTTQFFRASTARYGSVKIWHVNTGKTVPCRASTVATTVLPGTARLDCGRWGCDSK